MKMKIIRMCLNFSERRLLHREHNSLTRLYTNGPHTQRTLLPLQSVFMKSISLIGEEQANILANDVKDHLRQYNTPILIMRAGDGLFAKNLLEAGLENIYIYERRTAYRQNLRDLQAQHSEKCKYDVRTFNEIFFEDSSIPVYHSPYLKASLPYLGEKKWEDSPSVRIVASHSNGKVLLVTLAHLCKNMMHFNMGRPQLILTIPTSCWKKFLADPRKVNYQDYQRAGLLFPDFYDCEVLGTLGPPVQYSSGESVRRISKEEFLTVSIAPKKELKDHANPELLEEFLFFGTQTMNGKAKHLYIIPTLEKWAPGSGKTLVANGVDCFTQFMDLSAQEALKIFKLWKTSNNYQSSLFMHEFNDYLKYSDSKH